MRACRGPGNADLPSIAMSFLTRTIQEISPPFVVRIAELFRRRLRNLRRSAGNGQKDAAWYDASFEDRAHWKRHYSESACYFLWTVISDRICRQEPPRVLEIGCGSGQLAELLHDRGVSGYCGLDFSPKRIAHARKRCPACRFEIADVFESDLLETRITTWCWPRSSWSTSRPTWP